MDSLHFIPNNMLTKKFKELTKYKNNYQQYLNYIQELYYVSYCISLSVPMHMHEAISQYILIGKVQRKFNQNLNQNSILHYVVNLCGDHTIIIHLNV